jgi:hypothetical protein
MKTKVEWVRESDVARAFSSSVDALAYCVAAGLCDIRLVVNSGTGSDSFLYPFGEERKPQGTSVPARRLGAAKLLQKITRPGAKVGKPLASGLNSRAQSRSKPRLPT